MARRPGPGGGAAAAARAVAAAHAARRACVEEGRAAAAAQEAVAAQAKVSPQGWGFVPVNPPQQPREQTRRTPPALVADRAYHYRTAATCQAAGSDALQRLALLSVAQPEARFGKPLKDPCAHAVSRRCAGRSSWKRQLETRRNRAQDLRLRPSVVTARRATPLAFRSVTGALYGNSSG